ncbi:MAG: hypothetical protein ACKOYK_08770 [Cyanobium sp.]
MTPAQAVTIWDWAFTTTDPQQFGSGTFTTADVIPTINTPYQITGISGTYNRGGTAYSITSLDSTLTNIFYYDGTSTSPIIVDFLDINNGISFTDGSQSIFLTYDLSPGRAPINNAPTTFLGADASIASSSLRPVPGPLPLFGAAAVFATSRRLRKRIKLHSQPPVA